MQIKSAFILTYILLSLVSITYKPMAMASAKYHATFVNNTNFPINVTTANKQCMHSTGSDFTVETGQKKTTTIEDSDSIFSGCNGEWKWFDWALSKASDPAKITYINWTHYYSVAGWVTYLEGRNGEPIWGNGFVFHNPGQVEDNFEIALKPIK